jgi:hypothetical protein
MSKSVPIKLESLSLENIPQILGGAIAVKVNKELRKAYLDCEDSPELNSARSVTLTLKLKPRMRPAAMGGRSEFEGCNVSFGIGGRTPSQEVEIPMIASPQGLLFNPLASDNPRQMTIDPDEYAGDE